jgi:hypothetical protein
MKKEKTVYQCSSNKNHQNSTQTKESSFYDSEVAVEN